MWYTYSMAIKCSLIIINLLILKPDTWQVGNELLSFRPLPSCCPIHYSFCPPGLEQTLLSSLFLIRDIWGWLLYVFSPQPHIPEQKVSGKEREVNSENIHLFLPISPRSFHFHLAFSSNHAVRSFILDLLS